MKGQKTALVSVKNTLEVPKYMTALIPEKKSNCGKCKECKCQNSSQIPALAVGDKRRQ